MRSKYVFSFVSLFLILLGENGCSFSWRPWHHRGLSPKSVFSAYRDDALQALVFEEVHNAGLNDAAKSGSFSLGLLDVSDLDNPRFAEISSTDMYYAASLPKILILFGLLKRVELGTLYYSKTYRTLLEEMIRESSNGAARLLWYDVGPAFILSLSLDTQFQLYSVPHGGGLWLGKEYGPEGSIARDPVGLTSHGANATSVLQFYYRLLRGELLNPDLTREALRILSDSKLPHMVQRAVHQCCPEATVMRKSGRWGKFVSDSAIVEQDGDRYIFVMLTQDPEGEKWVTELSYRMFSKLLG